MFTKILSSKNIPLRIPNTISTAFIESILLFVFSATIADTIACLFSCLILENKDSYKHQKAHLRKCTLLLCIPQIKEFSPYLHKDFVIKCSNQNR